MSEDEVTVYLKAHEEEPAYAKLAMYDNLIEAVVPIIEDVPSACLNATIIATHDGLVGTQITVFIMTVMNLFWKAGRIRSRLEICLSSVAGWISKNSTSVPWKR